MWCKWAAILLCSWLTLSISRPQSSRIFSIDGGGGPREAHNADATHKEVDTSFMTGGYIPDEALMAMGDMDGGSSNGERNDWLVEARGMDQYRGQDGEVLTTARANEAEFEVASIGDNKKFSLSETSLGKDKEIFHVSFDFIQVWELVSRRSTWNSLARKMMKTVAKITGRDDYNVLFKEVAVDMLGDIRRQNRESPLKLFKGTMKQAEAYARGRGAFIIVYIEDGAGSSRTDLTEGSKAFRKALSDPELGDLLNSEEFVFFAGSTRHNPTFRLARLLGPIKKKDFPIFMALSPSYVDTPPSRGTKGAHLPEKIAALTVPQPGVIDSKKLIQFLNKVKRNHLPALQAKKKEFMELLQTEEEHSDPSESRISGL